MIAPLQRFSSLLLGVAVFVGTSTVWAQGTDAIMVFRDSASFTAELQARSFLGHAVVNEDFEDDAIWGHARSSISDGMSGQHEVSNFGLRWQSNHADAVTTPAQITTGEGAAYNGSWGVFSLPHGDPDVESPTSPLHDGFHVESQLRVFSIGGWFKATYGSHIVAIIDGEEANPVELGILNSAFQFYGVVSQFGFHALEIRELEGVVQDRKYLWGDSFIIEREDVAELPVADAGGFVDAGVHFDTGTIDFSESADNDSSVDDVSMSDATLDSDPVEMMDDVSSTPTSTSVKLDTDPSLDGCSCNSMQTDRFASRQLVLTTIVLLLLIHDRRRTTLRL